MKIGIIGRGFVGSAVNSYFKDAIVYDKFKKIGSLDEVNKCNFIFLCLPTPKDKKYGFDYSAFEEVISQIKDGKTIIIKSTVQPYFTKLLAREYPNKIFLFNPEFLTEKNANEDFSFPDRQIIGYTTMRSYWQVKKLLKILPKGLNGNFVMKSEEAEMVKLWSNAFLTTKVVFFNLIYDICNQEEMNFDNVRKGIITDERIGSSHTKIFHNKGRGAGGHCFPKDLYALIDWIDLIKFPKTMFLKVIQTLNNKWLKESGKK